MGWNSLKSTAKDVIVIIKYPHRCFASGEFYLLFLSWKHTEWSQLESSRGRRYQLATRRSAVYLHVPEPAFLPGSLKIHVWVGWWKTEGEFKRCSQVASESMKSSFRRERGSWEVTSSWQSAGLSNGTTNMKDEGDPKLANLIWHNCSKWQKMF